jgi:hypothetical protein
MSAFHAFLITLLVFELLYRAGICNCGVTYHWRLAKRQQALRRASSPRPPPVPWGDILTLFVVVGLPIIFVAVLPLIAR